MLNAGEPPRLYHYTTRQVADDILELSCGGYMVATAGGRLGDGIYATSLVPTSDGDVSLVEATVFDGQQHDPPLDAVIVFVTDGTLEWEQATDKPSEYVARVDASEPAFVLDDIETVLTRRDSSWRVHPHWA